MIARHGPGLSGLRVQAERSGNGWLYATDGRTPIPDGEVPPHDKSTIKNELTIMYD